MKFNSLFAAALVMTAGASPIALAAPASAQRTVVHERTVVRHDDVRPHRRPRVETRRVCTNRFDHGHRQRVCRTVRHRR